MIHIDGRWLATKTATTLARLAAAAVRKTTASTSSQSGKVCAS
jgi:hypothetical protein